MERNSIEHLYLISSSVDKLGFRPGWTNINASTAASPEREQQPLWATCLISGRQFSTYIMTNNETFYRWTKFKDGVGSVAKVTLDVSKNNSDQNKIVEHYSEQGFTSQGNIEDIPENGYDSWKIAARHGLEYAFSLIDTFWTVEIIKIEGRAFTDTNPTIVAYTVLRAFLDKIDFQLNLNQIEILEEFVLSSWTKPYKELIPNFFSWSFTEYKNEK